MKERWRDGKVGGEEGETEEVGVEGKQERGKEGRTGEGKIGGREGRRGELVTKINLL